MENGRRLWEELGLPKLQPREPWFGYELGYWSDEEREEAELALAGKHYEVGERAERIGRSFSVLHPKSVDPLRRHSWITVHGCAEFRCRGWVSNPPYGKTLARLCSKPGNQVETKRRSLFR